jgi:DNA repair protein RecO (recombination protein O)
MSQKYKATGIVLKGSSLKETDRLVTILTSEYGLIRAVAPGAKKHKSRLRGRTELFVISELLIVPGRSLDKIVQADTIYTYPGLSRDIGKLACAQYLAELALALALSEQPQTELYELLNEHLRRIEQLTARISVYPYLAQAVFHLLAIAGLAPQVYACCLTQSLLPPNLTAVNWQVGFSFQGGGVVDLALQKNLPTLSDANSNEPPTKIDYRLNGAELTILQLLNHHSLPTTELVNLEAATDIFLEDAWMRIEKILREYIQYQIGKSIRSATLIDKLYVEF